MFNIPGLWLDNAVIFISTVEISWDIFRILVDYCLRHLANNVAIHIITL
jgi:hypothetical protein